MDFSRKSTDELIEELHIIDPHAFVIATEATEVKGNGFSFDYKV